MHDAKIRKQKPQPDAADTGAQYAEAKRQLAAANKEVTRSTRNAATAHKRADKARDNAMALIAELKKSLSTVEAKKIRA